MEHRLLAICFDFGDTLIDQATEVKDDSLVTQSAEMIPGAAEMLRELKARGYRLAIVSNGPVGSVANGLSQHGLLELFDVCAISDALDLHKPDPAIFHHALEQMGISPADAGRTVMVGNHLDRDVKGANAAGMISVWIDWSPRYPKFPFDASEVPEHTVRSPLELLPLIEYLDRPEGVAPRQPALIHHAANRGRRHPPGSLSGLRDCLEAGARIVEVDLSATADGELVLLHGPLLDRETTGSGPIAARSASQVAELRRQWKGSVIDEQVGGVQDALALLTQHPSTAELQLDLKADAPLDGRALERLVSRLEPVRERVRVTSYGDWLLRRLHALDPELHLGFDPLLYLDVSSGEAEERGGPPVRRGAYGYLDEHPLAGRRWGSAADYLAARADCLFSLVPTAGVWYIAARMLAQALDDGFDFVAYLHARGCEVDAWTLDADRAEDLALARLLAAQGVDRITTNDADALGAALARPIP